MPTFHINTSFLGAKIIKKMILRSDCFLINWLHVLLMLLVSEDWDITEVKNKIWHNCDILNIHNTQHSWFFFVKQMSLSNQRYIGVKIFIISKSKGDNAAPPELVMIYIFFLSNSIFLFSSFRKPSSCLNDHNRMFINPSKSSTPHSNPPLFMWFISVILLVDKNTMKKTETKIYNSGQKCQLCTF